MRKYLLLLLAAMLAVAMIGLGTFAYFTDTEAGNATGDTGIINIKINGQDDAFSVAVHDLKPCINREMIIEIENVCDNPAVLRKHIGNFVDLEGSIGPESENDPDAWPDSIGECPLADVIEYDLKVIDASGVEHVIFETDDEITLAEVGCYWMPLGTLLPGEKMMVVQSYHLLPLVGNWAQDDVITFDMTFLAEQRLGIGPVQKSQKLFLDNKTGPDNWDFIADQTWGVLDFTDPDDASLEARGLAGNTGYSLVTYTDPWPGSCIIIDNGTSDASGNLALSGMTMPAGYEGKIWLVLSSDVAPGGMTGYHPTAYLYETNLVDVPL